jgi:hypothetical protein
MKSTDSGWKEHFPRIDTHEVLQIGTKSRVSHHYALDRI